MNYVIPVTMIMAVFAGLFAWPVVKTFRHVFCVPEGWTGLVYHHGLYIRRNNPGRDIVWGRGWTMKLIDLRKTSVPVAGQEVLTSDNVGLKLSLLVTYQVEEPVKAAHGTQNSLGDLYHAAQLALRTVINGIAAETLLHQRPDIGAQLLARVQTDTAKIGFNVLAVEVKDVILPNDLKRAFADVLKARQEGLAALERARGESAALRNLANAARVLDGNPALMNLRLMQSLSAAQHAGNTLVVGMPGGFAPIHQNGKAGSTARSDAT
jgi:regulator of protease activity HflC (stomatin/prohibitin superfamily)